MFLQPLLSKNQAFVRNVIDSHQSGALPANTYVIDLDAVAANTTGLMKEAAIHGLTVYAMTKQIGRCPAALDAITASGIDGYVAVDMAGARPITANGHNLGHLGHLVQIPSAEATEAAAMRPDYWTVFSLNKAAQASAAAGQVGGVQDLLVRVWAPEDEFYPGHQGGIALQDLPAAIDHIRRLSHVRFAGVTTFPALLFDEASRAVRTTRNVATLGRAVDIATKHLGAIDIPLQVNAPGTTSMTVLQQLADIGATQVEPGHGLTGTTPLHAVSDLPEHPAVLYLSEIAHIHQGKPLCFGGGLYVDPVFEKYEAHALIAHDSDEVTAAPVPVDIPNPAGIDYYTQLHPDPGRTVDEGASVIFGFRIQAFVTRAQVAAISGISTGQPKIAGVWDTLGNRADWAMDR